MSNLMYFQPRHHRTPENKMILSFVPKDITEMDKADEAEKFLTPDQYFKYLCMILIYNAYDLVSSYHQNNIENFVRGGLLDELAVSTDSNLTDCYVSSDSRFICNNREFKLPEGYIPLLRIENVSGEIIVEAVNKDKEEYRYYEFTYYKSNKKYTWKRIFENDYLVDF